MPLLQQFGIEDITSNCGESWHFIETNENIKTHTHSIYLVCFPEKRLYVMTTYPNLGHGDSTWKQ